MNDSMKEQLAAIRHLVGSSPQSACKPKKPKTGVPIKPTKKVEQ